MKVLHSMILALAKDNRISDRHFRRVLRELFEHEDRNASFDSHLRALALDALYETERDKYVK